MDGCAGGGICSVVSREPGSPGALLPVPSPGQAHAVTMTPSSHLAVLPSGPPGMAGPHFQVTARGPER